MADIIELDEWAPGIYQLEEEDLVLGGAEGIDNLQAKQLASRTNYLKLIVEALGNDKQPIDAMLTALAAMVTSADKTLYFTGPDAPALTPLTAFIRTLLGSADAAAARVVLEAAALDSPNFTGTPAGPTAAPGTNTNQLSTTAFVQAAIAAILDSSPATLNTLNELAAALGDDANFAATITNALALKAALASPVFSGNPTAPTPAQFDNDQSVATTEFVQRMGGNFRGYAGITVSTTLDATHCGKIIYANSATPITLTLSGAATLPGGAAFFVVNTGIGAVTLARGGADTIVPGAAASPITSVTLNTGDSFGVVSLGGGTQWYPCGGSAQLAYSSVFGASLGASGYQKLPSGLIVQWGVLATTAANTLLTVTLPIAFPVGGLGGLGNAETTTTGSAGAFNFNSFPNASQVTFHNSSTFVTPGRYLVWGR